MSSESGPQSAGTPPRLGLLVIFNPAAGRRRRRKLDAALAVLRTRGIAVDVAETTGSGDAERMATDAGAEVTMVVVAGGDGTITEAINGLMAGSAAGRAVPPLGILPLGTANVLAGEIGLPMDARAAAAILAEGRTARINLGLANGRYFSIMAGVGFDARVVDRINPAVKRFLGKGAYILESLRELLARQSTRYRVTADGRELEAAAVVIASGRYYAGRFVLAPAASLTGRHLQICLFRRSGRWAVVRYLVAMVLGMLPRLGDYQVIPADAVTVAGPDGEPVQADGDIVARLPLSAELVPRALEVVVPAGRSPREDRG